MLNKKIYAMSTNDKRRGVMKVNDNSKLSVTIVIWYENISDFS